MQQLIKSTKRHWSGQIAKLHRDANRPRVVDQGGGEMVAELERPLPPPRLTGQRRQAQLNREMGERSTRTTTMTTRTRALTWSLVAASTD